MWRPGFRHEGRARGFVKGWARRFWQGSPDHRGWPEAPGRVVTLVPSPAELCWGLAYRLPEADRAELLRYLDHREQGGYERVELEFCADGATRSAARRALAYVARSDNDHYLGPDDPDAMAWHVHRSRGPSGENAEYVLELDRALQRLGVVDPHVVDLAVRVRALSR
jgi:cation transport regulator ChaC